ncbi:MAG: DUF4367 domain-containing protein [Oscillospiraceae bacterium]|nr:DUF4367 domain-containing protein [Oscillospiraceae bacterium]
MDNSDFKSKIFDEVLKIVVKDSIKKEIAEYNDVKEDERHTFSPEFESKMTKILKRGKKFKTDFRKNSLKIIERTAVVILIILSLSFVSLFSVEAVRTEVYNMIITFYEKFININFKNTDNQNFIMGVIPEIIGEVFLPSYIPEEYWEDDISKSDVDVRAVYTNDEGKNIIYYQMLLSAVVSVDGEEYIENDITINGNNGKIYEYNKADDIVYYIIVWNDNKYFYQIYSFSNKEETIKVAESVVLHDVEK